jgi:hypothetical protein
VYHFATFSCRKGTFSECTRIRTVENIIGMMLYTFYNLHVILWTNQGRNQNRICLFFPGAGATSATCTVYLGASLSLSCSDFCVGYLALRKTPHVWSWFKLLYAVTSKKVAAWKIRAGFVISGSCVPEQKHALTLLFAEVFVGPLYYILYVYRV